MVENKLMSSEDKDAFIKLLRVHKENLTLRINEK